MEETTETWNVFRCQSKMFARGETMLEDFVYICLDRKIPEEQIISSLGEYYRQCEQVCKEIYQRVKNRSDK
jgi:hypothetical protein